MKEREIKEKERRQRKNNRRKRCEEIRNLFMY